MKLREVRVRNFRNLVDVQVAIDDTTVLVGENNAGKTALIDAIRIALTRPPRGRSNPFSEYDFHLGSPKDTPHSSPGIEIELWFREDKPEEWPDPVVQGLRDIIALDPVSGRRSVGVRLVSKFDATTKAYQPVLSFLNMAGQPLGSKAPVAAMDRLLSYVRFFHQPALRDVAEEFSPRSRLWGQIMRDLDISEEAQAKLQAQLADLNTMLLQSDVRLEKVRASLEQLQSVLPMPTGKSVAIQALPLRPWDLLSRSEVVLRTHSGGADLPLARHGQGMQSLAVLFLHQAYVDVLLKQSFEQETEAIFALEEPEAHLHPQAVCALAANLDKISGQKIISTHSPYFVQDVPLAKLRLLRVDGGRARVMQIPRSFQVALPVAGQMDGFCGKHEEKFLFKPTDAVSGKLVLTGKMEQGEYRELLAMYPGKNEVHGILKDLNQRSQAYLSDGDLSQLEVYVKRVRGEILFARAWLLCEGQSEYLVLRCFAEVLGVSLDAAGVSIIDYQNNGSPGAFAALARALGFPWLMTCDTDAQSTKFRKEIENRGFSASEIADALKPLPQADCDLELFLVKNGFGDACREILKAEGQTPPGTDEKIAELLRTDKVRYAQALCDWLRKQPDGAKRVPTFFAELIHSVCKKGGTP
jgi:putative ATP-dependent endonuclease of OLD family